MDYELNVLYLYWRYTLNIKLKFFLLQHSYEKIMGLRKQK